jgi:hypothetical protein
MGANPPIRLKALVAPTLLVVLPLCLFGPHTILAGNAAEFSAPFWALVRPLLFAGAGIALALIAVGLAIPQTLFRAYVSLLFGLGLAIWIQGNFLVADYGPLDGTAIDWGLQSWRNPYEIALWILVPGVCVAAAPHVGSVAPFASGVLLTLQTVALVASAHEAGPRASAGWRGPSDSMFDLSRKQNIIHIVLDAFQSDFFHEILEESREELDQSLSGAVFFADHAGAFPTTMVSIPAMLTGTVYRQERPLPRYVREHFDKGSLFRSLRAHGYRVDSISEIPYDNKSVSNGYRVRRPHVSYAEYTQFAAWQLADLSLFRHAPHILRPTIYNDQAWRLQTMLGPGDTSGRRHFPVNGAAVLQEFANRLTPNVDEPVYKFIHVGIPHRPVTIEADCDYVEGLRPTRENYKAQARCGVTRLVALLDRLKDVGVYDGSLIVISSDHGIGYAPQKFSNDRHTPAGALATLSGKSLALLVVKAPNSRGAVRVSNAPTAISDIAATVLDTVGIRHTLPGEAALKLAENAPRVRTFAMYDWEHDGWKHNYFDALDVMEIRGRLLDGNSWTLIESLYPPDGGADKRTRGVHEVQRSRSGVVYRWSSPHGFFHAPPQARRFEIAIRSIAPKPQTVTFAAAGRVVDTVTLRDQSWVTVKGALPPPVTPATNWLELHVDLPWRPRGEARMLGVMTRDLIFSP